MEDGISLATAEPVEDAEWEPLKTLKETQKLSGEQISSIKKERIPGLQVANRG